jgi:FkbM family methyltransferase
MSHTSVHGVELLTDRDRIALLVEGSPVFASTRQGPQDFEPETAAAFTDAIQQSPGCVLDVGAYTGLFTLLAVRAGALEVVALEPNEAGYARLMENLQHGGALSKVRALRCAASASDGSAFFEVSDEQRGICSTGKVVPSPKSGVVVVPQVMIDSLMRKHRVSVLKLDVEGHELPALMGAAGTLRTDRPTVFVEVNSLSGGDRRDAVFGFLVGIGYAEGEPLDERNMVFRA